MVNQSHLTQKNTWLLGTMKSTNKIISNGNTKHRVQIIETRLNTYIYNLNYKNNKIISIFIFKRPGSNHRNRLIYWNRLIYCSKQTYIWKRPGSNHLYIDLQKIGCILNFIILIETDLLYVVQTPGSIHRNTGLKSSLMAITKSSLQHERSTFSYWKGFT